MIFPRGRPANRRYQRHKVAAILVTFAAGWLLLKFAPFDAGKVLREAILPPATPASAFEARDSEVPVRTRAVIGEALADSLGSGGELVAHRWGARSVDGHPFMLLRDSSAPLPAPQRGDTLLVRGTYHWDSAGGAVAVTSTPDEE